MKKSDVGLADLIETIHTLTLTNDDEQLKFIVSALGLPTAQPSPEPGDGPPAGLLHDTGASPTGLVVNAAENSGAPSPAAAATAPDAVSARPTLRPSWWEITDAPHWLRSAPYVPGATAAYGLRWPDPLLPPRRTSALLNTVVNRAVPGRDVDAHAVVEALARAQLPSPLPRREHWVPARTAHVLVDIGVGMQPFTTDQRDLVEAVEQGVGADNVEVIAFDGCPSRGAGTGPRRTWRPYEPPDPETVVVVASDLGLGGPPSRRDRPDHREWLRFAEAMANHAVRVVAFVPLPEKCWRDLPFARVLPICEWDRRARVSDLVAAMRAKRAKRTMGTGQGDDRVDLTGS